MIAYYGELVEEIIAAEQGGLPEGEEALLKLLKKKPHRESSSKPPKGGRVVNKGKIALKILKNRWARQVAVKALKNEKVRKVVAKQVSRRLLGG